MKHLYFIRHGLSEANKGGVWAGWDFDTPLAEEGIEQAKVAGAKAASEGLSFDLIISSPSVRAHETAKLIALATGYPIEKIQTDEILKERKFGELEGTNQDGIGEIHGKDETYVEKFNGVESMIDLGLRASDVLLKVKKLPEERILIVSHAGLGRALKRAILNVPYEKNPNGFVQIPNAEIFKVI